MGTCFAVVEFWTEIGAWAGAGMKGYGADVWGEKGGVEVRGRGVMVGGAVDGELAECAGDGLGCAVFFKLVSLVPRILSNENGGWMRQNSTYPPFFAFMNV